MFSRVKNALAVAATGIVLSVGGAQAATVVVNADEWALRNAGFNNAGVANASTFVSNLVSEFGPIIHAYSTNPAYTGASLATAMSAAGATYSTGTGFAFTAGNIAAFDGLLLGGNLLNDAALGVLSDYVAAGGNVYISAGTGAGGAVAEAAAWNGFLAPFGITLSAPYTGFSGNVDTTVSTDPLLSGVSKLFVNNPNGLSGNVICCDEEEIFAVVRTTDPTTPIPLPASALLLGSVVAAGGLYGARRTGRNAAA